MIKTYDRSFFYPRLALLRPGDGPRAAARETPGAGRRGADAACKTARVAAPAIFITELEPGGKGPRLAVKDLFDTAGIRTTYGSSVFGEHVPAATAIAVERLERAGYRNVGKANLHEFAWGITSENPHYGTVPNPLAAGRIAGGSSGGCAAALVADHADAALGTDSGGSIRIPAACCGITGFKPTHGLVPLDGCFPLAPSYDHAGPMALDVAGCEEMMQGLVPGFAPLRSAELVDLRIGVAWTERAEPLVRERVEATAALFPHRCALELPDPEGTYPTFAREAADSHRELFKEHRAQYGHDVGHKVERALQLQDEKVEAAAAERERYRERMAELMEKVDLVLTPTLKMVAPPTGIGDLALRNDMIELTFPFNSIGTPALALPCGPAEHGLPASVQLVGKPGDDALVLAAGRALERAQDAAASAAGSPRRDRMSSLR
jgi:aspartyl-tRNA(Asn)/glutamyl-tRNA(Gln) amidotransferase subunit A